MISRTLDIGGVCILRCIKIANMVLPSRHRDVRFVFALFFIETDTFEASRAVLGQPAVRQILRSSGGAEIFPAIIQAIKIAMIHFASWERASHVEVCQTLRFVLPLADLDRPIESIALLLHTASYVARMFTPTADNPSEYACFRVIVDQAAKRFLINHWASLCRLQIGYLRTILPDHPCRPP